MSLGAILNGPEEKMICEHFNRAMKIIVDLLGSTSTKIWEASSWLLHQIAIFAPDLIYNNDIFSSILSYAYPLWQSDAVSGGYLCSVIGKIAEANKV